MKLLLSQNTAVSFPQDLYLPLPTELLTAVLTFSLGKNCSLGNHFCRAAKFHSRQPRRGWDSVQLCLNVLLLMRVT